MTSPDLSRYPLWMMQCLSTAIIQHLQLNSESLPLGVGAHSPQPCGGWYQMMDGLATAILQRTKVPINFSGALGEFRAGCMGTCFLEHRVSQAVLIKSKCWTMFHHVEDQGRSPVWTPSTRDDLSPDLSRYPLWMMQCLSTAIIQHLQLNSESLPLGVGAHSPQPPEIDTKYGRVGHSNPPTY